MYPTSCAAYRSADQDIFLQGFDEFMNLVIDDAVEVKQATKTNGESRRELGKEHPRSRWTDHMDYFADASDNVGQILLKGDNVSLIQSLQG